jgi:uncharacterized protein (DUF983 family)
MKIKKPACPSCGKGISFLEVKKSFTCPHCGRALKSIGQGRVTAFEITAFFIFGAPLAVLFAYEMYLGVAVLITLWIGLELIIRNSFLDVTLDPDVPYERR